MYYLLSTVNEEKNNAIENEESRTELDSHANMPMVGRHAYVISDTGKVADVNPFTPDYNSMQVNIVDAAVQYECPYDGEKYILVIRNALYVPSMKNNLIPPFVMREAGIQISDTPKIQVDDPTVVDHSIFFPCDDFRIPLSLWGVFSYFPTSKPTAKEMMETASVYILTPSRWNPHCDSYATNEENMLDWEGNMVDKRRRPQILISEILEDDAMTASLQISGIESKMIDDIINNNVDSNPEEKVEPRWQPIPKDADEISGVLASVSPLLNDQTLYQKLSARRKLGTFQIAIGSCNTHDGEFLVDNSNSPQPSDDSDLGDSNDKQLLDELFEYVTEGTVNLDEMMVSAAHGGKSKGINAAHLAKIWQIDLDLAEKTLGITTQNSQRTDDPKLSRNYGTNDRMLRYKRIREHFFMDTFFATKKAGKSSRKNTCCQLFVTDKGYVYVVPMKSKSEALQAVKQFAKEIGAPEALINDMSGEQTSKPMKKFCNEIGTTLRVLEEGTPWSNKAELYIGLIKEAVRKDMKESNSPLAFWDYCVERRARINNLTAKNIFQLHVPNPHTFLTGDEGDISNLCQFKWYDW